MSWVRSPSPAPFASSGTGARTHHVAQLRPVARCWPASRRGDSTTTPHAVQVRWERVVSGSARYHTDAVPPRLPRAGPDPPDARFPAPPRACASPPRRARGPERPAGTGRGVAACGALADRDRSLRDRTRHPRSAARSTGGSGRGRGYVAKRAFREAFQAASKLLLAPIVGRRVALAGAPAPGFLAELYPDHADFALPVEDARILSSAWDWYEKGVHFPVLGYRLHPFYGAYIPARMEHLELFGTWLAKYKGARDRAIDVGTGSGVLALQMAKRASGTSSPRTSTRTRSRAWSDSCVGSRSRRRSNSSTRICWARLVAPPTSSCPTRRG